MPIEEMGEIARESGLVFMLDSAQGAGIFPIDVEKLDIDLLALLDELKQGGTGTESRDAAQPRSRPERYESGTLNTPGVAGLGKTLDFIEEVGSKLS